MKTEDDTRQVMRRELEMGGGGGGRRQDGTRL